MGKVHLQLAVLQQRKSCKLRTVVTGNGLEHLIALLCEVGHNLLQCLVDRFGSMVASLDPNTHPRHALDKREDARLVLTDLANDRVDLPVTLFSLSCCGGASRADQCS